MTRKSVVEMEENGDWVTEDKAFVDISGMEEPTEHDDMSTRNRRSSV